MNRRGFLAALGAVPAAVFGARRAVQACEPIAKADRQPEWLEQIAYVRAELQPGVPLDMPVPLAEGEAATFRISAFARYKRRPTWQQDDGAISATSLALGTFGWHEGRPVVLGKMLQKIGGLNISVSFTIKGAELFARAHLGAEEAPALLDLRVEKICGEALVSYYSKGGW